MKRIHIIGRKNCGKTTLVVELVKHFSALGFRVGTTKHTHHHHELDVPGKDSHRHREAGATAVGIVSPGMVAAFLPSPGQPRSGDDEYARLAPMFVDCDLVLVEGDINTKAPRIEVWRREAADSMIAETDNDIIAVVTDDDVSLSTPVWPRSDVPELAKKIIKLLELESNASP